MERFKQIEWIEAQLLELDYKQLAPVECIKSSGISCILKVRTTSGNIYFKEASTLPLFCDEPIGINLMGDKIENIFNFLQLSDSIATGGQPTKKQLSLVKDFGYKTVINLATSASENALPNEQEIVESLGMKYIHIPVDFNNPTSEDFAAFCQAMEENNQQPLLVHCAANLRVSAFMYIYRLTQENFDSEQAKVDLAKVWTPNETWQQFIDSQLHR